MMDQGVQWSAFQGYTMVSNGTPRVVALEVKELVTRGHEGSLLVFDRGTGVQVDIDLRGSSDDVARWVEAQGLGENGTGASPSEASSADVYADADAAAARASAATVTAESAARRAPGRPRLGVVSREITLLPRHWDWLNSQSGGASAAIRRLVDDAKVRLAEQDRQRAAKDRTYRFMSSIGGNLPGFEEATRALFANDSQAFQSHLEGWPGDVRDLVLELAANGIPRR